MADHDVRIYDADPSGVFSTSIGSTFLWTGPDYPDGTATITDNELGYYGETLDDDTNGETATANVSIDGTTSTGTTVDAEDIWTIQDTVTGETFQVARFHVETGGAAGFYTLSETPLVAGRTYEVVTYDTNPNAGTDDPVFSYADYVGPNNIVTGTSGNDTIDGTYAGDPEGDMVDDGNGGGATGNDNLIEGLAGDDTILSGAGDDVVHGGIGSDSVDAGAGNDTIYGDSAGPNGSGAEEFLDWSAQGADETSLTAGFTQTTGSMDVTVSITDDGNNNPSLSVESSSTTYVGSGEVFDPLSSGQMSGSGGGATSTVTIDFAAGSGSGMTNEVGNVSFRIADIDMGDESYIDVITINAYDALGNPVSVTITPGANDSVSGNTITAGGGENGVDAINSANGSALIEIAGPLSMIEIIYSNSGSSSQSIYVSDVHFEPIPAVPTEADTLSGGLGDDIIYGEQGNDSIDGGDGNDSLYGGDGADSMTGGAGTDTMLGDAGADTMDGGTGADSLDGGAGNDSLTGAAGVDTIIGGVGDDAIDGGADNDVLYGSDGADSISGGDGDDVIYGDDATPPVGGSESVNWSAPGADGTDLSAGITQTTGEMEVSVSFTSDGDNLPLYQVETTDTGYVGTGEVFDPNSNLYLYGNGDAATSTTSIDFAAAAGSTMSDEVQNVSFRINDIDWGTGNHQDIVTINAFDALGNPVTVTITPDGTQTVTGNTITADLVATNPQDATGSVLVEIAGPLSSIEISYSNALTGTQAVWVSDIHFDTILEVGAGFDDVIDGGAGADIIDAGVGDDTLDGGTGDDTLTGNSGDDIFELTDSFGNDSITGGETNETVGDTLDTSGLTTGVDVTFTSADGEEGTATVGADTASFEEIKNVVYTDQNDTIDASLTIVDMDINAAGGDDSIIGGSGTNNIDGGAGNDTIAGGAGDDILTGGTGADTFVYTAGDGADVITDFDTTTGISADPDSPLADQTDNDFVDLSTFYDAAAVAAYNAANGGLEDAIHELALMRADAADGTLDGIINGIDLQGEIAGLNLTLESGGSSVDATTLNFENTAVVCFGRGTLITTEHGDVPVEDLTKGDLILTADNGYQPIRWIGSNQVSGATLDKHENLRPIRICAGALGNGAPAADLIVSPQHRILVRSKIAQRMFGEDEVLVAARQLLLLDGIDIATEEPGVEYFHFLFDRHEIVCSDGAWTESLYTGPMALNSVNPAARSEIMTLFPELNSVDYVARPSRRLATGRMGRKLAARHVKNSQPLVAVLSL